MSTFLSHPGQYLILYPRRKSFQTRVLYPLLIQRSYLVRQGHGTCRLRSASIRLIILFLLCLKNWVVVLLYGTPFVIDCGS